MPASSSQRSKTIRPAAPPPIRWRVWYLAEHPGWAVGWCLLQGAVWWSVLWVTGRGYLAGLAVGMVMLASWRLLTPIRYELSPEGVLQAVGGLQWKIPWKAIGRYETAESGVWLWPTKSPRPMDALRAIYLPWGEHREAVLSHLRYHLESGVF